MTLETTEPQDLNAIAQTIADKLSDTAASFLLDAVRHPFTSCDLYFADWCVFIGGEDLTPGKLTPIGKSLLAHYCRTRGIPNPAQD